MIYIYNTYFDDNIPHWHNRVQHVQYHILVLVTDGRLYYKLNKHSFYAAKGELLFIPAGTKREALNAADTTHQKYAVIFSLSEHEMLPRFKQDEHILLRSGSFEYYKEKMQLLHRHSVEKRPYYEVIRTGILLELLGSISRELDSSPLPMRKLQYARTIEHYIIQRFRSPITLQEIAQLIDRSPNYALAVFKEVTGQTPHEYIQHLRLATAMDLLQNTNLTVKAISEHLGYYDTSYFYKMFRKHTGISPSQYAALPIKP